MNPDNDIPMWKQDILGGLIGALRAWLPQAIQHLFAGGNDNTVREVETKEGKKFTIHGPEKTTKYIKSEITDE